MCSNTGNTACGCGTGGGNNGAGSIWSSGVKKQPNKRPRVPKRGPGVAELEKILREQQDNKIDIIPERGINGGGEGFSFPNPYHHHHSSLKPPQHSPPPPPLPPRRMTIPSPPEPPTPHLPPCPKPAYGYEKELFPMGLTSCKSKSNNNLNEGLDLSQSDSGNSESNNNNPIWSQKRNNQYPPPPLPPPMMNHQFLGGGAPASSGSVPIGIHNNHIEPPSNQSSYYNPTSKALHQEHKIAAIMRSHPPPPNFQVPPIFSNFNNRPQQPLVNIESRGASSFTSANECYRDAKWGSTLELNNSRKFNSENGMNHANFPPFVTTTTLPPEVVVHAPPMHLFQGVVSKGNNVHAYHVTEDRNEDSNKKRSESSGTDHKPFYNFLEVSDPEWGEGAPGQNHGRRGEAGSRRGIDLSLKL